MSISVAWCVYLYVYLYIIYIYLKLYNEIIYIYNYIYNIICMHALACPVYHDASAICNSVSMRCLGKLQCSKMYAWNLCGTLRTTITVVRYLHTYLIQSHIYIYICKSYSNHIQVTTSLYGYITSTFPFCAPSSHSTVSAPPLTISSSCRPSSGWSNARVPLKPTTTEPCAAASCLRSCCNCQK